MPLFEFQCRTCGHRFETLQFSTNRTLPLCPACDGQDLEKLYSTFGVSSGSSGGSRKSAGPTTFSGG